MTKVGENSWLDRFVPLFAVLVLIPLAVICLDAIWRALH